jgi:hypothetical protein
MESSFQLAGAIALIMMCLGLLTLLYIERWWR